MPTQSSGPISFSDLDSFLGTGRPLSIGSLYRAGSYVPDITSNNHVPTSGPISMQNMYSTWANRTLSFTITVGSISVAGKGKGTYYGYGATSREGGAFGSISNSTFLTPNGSITIEGLFFNTGSSSWNLQLSGTSSPDDTDLSFKSVSVSGYSINGIRSSRTSTSVASPSRRWTWVVSDTSHPTSGTISCLLNYYG